MNNFIRYWNQNRKNIIIKIAIVAFIIIIIQLLNNFIKNNKNEQEITKKTEYKTEPIQSVITGEKVSEEKTEENTKIIKDFVDYCNNKRYQEAYEILTEDCKKELGNNINMFITKYCDIVFKTNKTYSLELWFNTANTYTYKIKYYENNLLATGGSSLEKNIEDYITIIHQNKENKISINGFITKETINKSQTSSDIEISVNHKKVYKNYEIYNITIRNKSNKTINLSKEQNNKDICLLDENNVTYLSFLNEITQDNLILEKGYEKNIDIRFNKIYDLTRKIKYLQFSNITLNQDTQDNNEEKINITIQL